MRKLIGYVASAAFGIAFVATCGSMKGGGFGDGGSPFDIAGLDISGLDIAGADAQSAPAMMSACDQTNVRTQSSAGTSTAYSTFLAEVSVAGLDPTTAPHVSAVECDFEQFGAGQTPIDPIVWSCPSSNCVETGYTPPSGYCRSAETILASGKVVVYCGYRITNTNTSTGAVTSDGGWRAKSVYVRVN